jgi:predicted transcriptional regulator
MKKQRSQRERILSYIQRRPTSGATRRELAQSLDILHQSVGPRVVDLVSLGKIRGTGKLRDGCEVLVPVRGEAGK